MDRMKLVDKAITLAESKRINQAELARLIGVAPSRLSEWKKDEGKPSVDQAFRMARVLETSLDYLADDSLDVPPPPALSEDERFILQLVRDLKVSRKDAANALADAAKAPGYGPKDVVMGRPGKPTTDVEGKARKKGG